MSTTSKINFDADKLKQAFESLNTEQKLAVAQIDGPVMVIAGPGTGKTQILSLRIANILLTTDVLPENILCLTYTDAGVVAMRSRLSAFIGTDAYRVQIHTYHSFCNSIIQDNRPYFANTKSLDHISDLEVVEIIEDIVNEMSNDNPLKTFKDNFNTTYTSLKSFFSTVKKEQWSAEYLLKQSEDYLEAMKYDDSMFYKRKSGKYNAGDFKENDYKKLVDSHHKFKAAIQAFENYNAKMSQKGKYDFDDMINFVIHELERNADLLADYQEKLQYILVDEFQDSNGSQIKLLNILLSYWDAPNVFVVGDEDQAIYRFQGADISNISNFIQKYQDQNLKIISLKTNYRSVQPILDASYALIKNNKERLAHLYKNSELYHEDFEKQLLAFKGKGAEHAIEFLKFQNTATQDLGVVNQIEELLQKGVAHEDIAVLYGKNKEAENLLKWFNEKQIPFDVRYGVNVLEHKLVNQLVDVLTYIYYETYKIDYAADVLFRILHHDYLQTEVVDIANISRFIKDHKEEKWREVIGNSAKLLRLGLYNSSAITSASDTLNSLLKMSFNINIEELLEEVLLRMGIYKYIFREENQKYKHEDLQVIATFFGFVKAETIKEKGNKLKGLLEMISSMKEYNISLNCERIIANDKGIQLRTAHSSKGLEYKYVFILNATQEYWEKKRGNTMNQISLPNNMVVENNLAEEQRRLFYVAMTRAESKLFICIPLCKLTGKSQIISEYVVSIEPNISQDRDFPVRNVSLELASKYVATTLKKLQITDELIDQKILNEALRTFTMSASSLNKYLTCKLAFYFEQILKVPTARSSALAFGSMVHNVLEEIFKYINTHKKVPTWETVKEFYEIQAEKFRYSFHERQYEKRKQQGYKVIEEYYKHYSNTWDVHKFYQTEKALAGNFEKIPLFGKLDNIIINDNRAVVVDYKTGNPDNSKIKTLPPNEKNPQGGDIWRQVIFYQILLIVSKYKFDMEYGLVDFLEKSKKEDQFLKFQINPDIHSIEIVKGQIRTAWEGIKAHDFEGCGEEKCVWCQFVKGNYKKIRYVESEDSLVTEEES
ncbi:MAG: ATP-dependent DNA helicase [Cytophagales bacterium]